MESQEEPRKFPDPVLSREQWNEVRRSVEAGLDIKEAAQAFGVEYEAVKKRAQREQWFTKTRIRTLAEELAEKKAETVKLSSAVPSTVSASVAIAESLEGYRSQTLLSLAKLAKKGVETAAAADLPVENWQDAKIAAEIAMKLHQVGQESVQVNICNAFADMGEGAVVETETEIVSEDEGGDGGRDAYFVD